MTLKFLTSAVQELLHLSGQHEYQTFLAPENHLTILDIFAGLTEAGPGISSRFWPLASAPAAVAGSDSASGGSGKFPGFFDLSDPGN